MTTTIKEKTGTEVIVSLSEIKETFFVRKEFNEDRIFFFWNILDSDGTIDPIMITPDKELIDGRHRKRAYEMASKKDIKCIIVNPKNLIDKIDLAFSSNVTGGPLPPTFQDYVKYAYELLHGGESRVKTIEKLCHTLPKASAVKACDQARFALNRDNLNAAKYAVTEGDMKVTDAAKKYNVDEIALKELLEGKMKNKTSAKGLREIKNAVTTQFRSHGAKWSALLKKSQKLFEDGELSAKAYEEVLDTIEDNMKTSLRSVVGWKKRFEEQKQRM